MLTIRSSAIALLLLLNSFAYANTEQPLGAKQIQMWLNSSDAIQEWTQKQESLRKGISEKPGVSLTVNSMMEKLKTANVYDKAQKVIKGEGFDSAEQWAALQLRIVKAMVTLDMISSNRISRAESKLQEIKRNSSMNDKQKSKRISIIQTNIELMNRMANAPEADKKAIEPYLSKIKQKFNSAVKRR